jgi:hypothetical protein
VELDPRETGAFSFSGLRSEYLIFSAMTVSLKKLIPARLDDTPPRQPWRSGSVPRGTGLFEYSF